MARDVVPLRLAEDEKAAIAKAAAALKITVSEFLRRAGLATAFRLSGEQQAKPRPVVVKPEPGSHVQVITRDHLPYPVAMAEPEPQPTEPHYSATYTSFEAYRVESPYASGGPVFPPGGTMRSTEP